MTWTKVKELDVDKFNVVIETAPEDLHPSELFDDTVFNIIEICKDIDSDRAKWFMLRARVLVEGIELGNEIVGGLLYYNFNEVFIDGVVDGIVFEAVEQAKENASKLCKKLFDFA